MAAVLVPLVDMGAEWHILLTLRASHLRYHAGEVAFPGGMWEEGDDYPVTTALREAEEEIALPQGQVSLLGGLELCDTRHLTRVRPVVGVIPSGLPLIANKSEIEAIFTVPLRFFHEDNRLRTDIFKRKENGKEKIYWVPAYQFQQYEIWGLTAAMIVQLVNRCFNATLCREHHAPEKVW
ncbi:hypothetical protein AB835_12220 [Candidatus Endobugula sertula]|uniref:Nudix hydrolase domain-containing protein n=1 Tax=Candidatus Endobugula sertula TaxID=62101 RepID=A0A1D2QMM8_9GAMM|nr:hypothetical protein AB835_12220 [Candidatus Endobugula sertula]